MESVSNKKKSDYLSLAIIALVFTHQWVFVLGHSIYASVAITYISYLTIFALFGLSLSQHKIKLQSLMSTIWLPFVCYTLLGYLVESDAERVVYWFSFLLMILFASKADIKSSVPQKLILYTGLLAMVGVYFQLLLPSIYNGYIGHIFVNFEVLSIEDMVGMKGFTHQQGATSILLIYGEVALLYFKDVLPEFLKKKYVYYLLVFLMILSVLLTGKRTVSLIAISFPIIVYFLSAHKGAKRIGRALLVLGVLFIIYQLLLPIILSSDIFVIKRFASSLDAYQSGYDITSGREELWDLAFDAYHKNPIFGVGVGNYVKYTGADTDTHNTYLQVLCEQGLVGFITYVTALAICLLRTIHIFDKSNNLISKNYLKASIAIQFIFILYAFTGNLNIDVDIVMYFIAIMIAIYYDSNRALLR